MCGGRSCTVSIGRFSVSAWPSVLCPAVPCRSVFRPVVAGADAFAVEPVAARLRDGRDA
ncbi:hypothetical protein AB0D67_02910 [Streptosporangium sp. NPDC048047]|uniref:hypothetical protein n=1 Tax=Streptosporangium sp. NPDC048047 TaxID=3155748 RepID=UPI003425BF5A